MNTTAISIHIRQVTHAALFRVPISKSQAGIYIFSETQFIHAVRCNNPEQCGTHFWGTWSLTASPLLLSSGNIFVSPNLRLLSCFGGGRALLPAFRAANENACHRQAEPVMNKNVSFRQKSETLKVRSFVDRWLLPKIKRQLW